MSTDHQERLQVYRETMPVLTMLNDVFQKNEKLSGDYFSRLYRIAWVLRLVPESHSPEEYQWEKIVGFPDSQWEHRESYYTDETGVAKKYLAVLLTYVKGVIDAEEARQSSDAIDQLTKELTAFRAQLGEVLNKIAVHLPSEEKFESLNQSVNELTNKLGQAQSKLVRQIANSDAQDMKINQIDKSLQDARKELDELRKQQTTLLGLLVKAEKAKKDVTRRE